MRERSLHTVNPVCRADDEVGSVDLVDEQLGFDGFGDAQLDRLVSRRRHQDRASDGERTAKLDRCGEVRAARRPRRKIA
jgi:hypothetical protein